MNRKVSILHGIAASPGIAIGKAILFRDEEFNTSKIEIGKDDIKKEIKRFGNALSKTNAEMLATKEKIYKTLGKEYARLADAHLLILQDPLITREVTKIISDGINAEYALSKVLEKVIHSFEMIDDEYFRERKHDIADVGKKLLSHLAGGARRTIADIKTEGVVVGHNFTPSDTLSMRENLLIGFATDIGGKTSHTAILAQSLEIPAVVGLKDITAKISEGDTIVVDGNQGIVVINPSLEILENYRREKEIQLEQTKELEKLRDLPAQTIDGHRIVIGANIDNPSETASVLSHGAEGVGLYRSEFIYFNRSSMPSEEEHYKNYSRVAQKMMPYSVIVRTFDIGGDKLSSMGIEGVAAEGNPFLGMRAIRLSLKYPKIFKTQLRGILRASAEGKVKIMYPMISGLGELLAANKILEETKEELRSEGKKFDESIEVGVMIEVPSAALIADLIVAHCDFLSIGTNDLIQYTLAVDRVNENVASLYDPLHPAILRLIKNVVEAAHRAGKWVGLCGEMAADPSLTVVLVGLGLNELSVSPVQAPKIKKIIRNTSYAQARDLANDLLESPNREELIKRFKRHTTP